MSERPKLAFKTLEDIQKLIADASFFHKHNKLPAVLNTGRTFAEAVCRHVIDAENIDTKGFPIRKMELDMMISLVSKWPDSPEDLEAELKVLATRGNPRSHYIMNCLKEGDKSLQTLLTIQNVADWFFGRYGNVQGCGSGGGLEPRLETIPAHAEQKTQLHLVKASPETVSDGETDSKKNLIAPLHSRTHVPWAVGVLAVVLLSLGAGFLWMKPNARVAKSSPMTLTPLSNRESEGAPLPKHPDAKRIAVLYFDNNSATKALDPLRTGLADMLITDLDGVRSLSVIEREKLNAVLKELNLQASKTVDASTSQRLGRILGVEYLLLGSYFELMGQLRLDARLVRVETGEIVRSEGVAGPSQGVFDLERELALKLIDGLGARLVDTERETLRRPRGADFQRMMAYAKALDLYDNGDRPAAVAALEKLLENSPEFPQAKSTLARMRGSS